MQYEERKCDLFSVSDDYFLAHCISADFGMGRGIVVEFNKRFDMKNRLLKKYPDYHSYYERHRIGGDCILEGRVLNLITKERYYEKPSIITMLLALQKMKSICEKNGIVKVAMPTIGAGLDKLPWNEVSEQIKQVCKDTGMEILVCKLVD